MYHSRLHRRVALLTVACSGAGPEQVVHETPATVEHPRTEAELSTVTLTPEAVKRLGIETVAVRTDRPPSTRTLGGEIVVPEGRGVVVTAPVAGTLTRRRSAPPGRARAPRAIG